MPYLLVALTVFQFVFRIVGLQNSGLYYALNPYVISLPFIIFWLGASIVGHRRVDRNLLAGWLFVLLFPCIMLRDFNGDVAFLFVFFRGLQFFWGPLLLIPAFLGFFRMIGYQSPTDDALRRYIPIMAGIAGSLTLFELFAVHVLGIPPLTFPWIGNPDELHQQDINPFRPWGLPSYPQPNALIMGYLFWLAVVWKTKGIYPRIAPLIGVLLSSSGTGVIGLVAMSPLVFRRAFVLMGAIFLPAIALVAWATLTEQFAAATAFGRFDLAYLGRLLFFLRFFIDNFLYKFTPAEFLLGTNNPTPTIVTGVTHDWAYIDVFYAYGIAGVCGYLLLFGTILYLAIPSSVPASRRAFFALAGLALNFHYGTLNFYSGQLIFSSLVALRINGIYSREPPSRMAKPEATPA